jgi:hypothetical protein
VLWLECSVSLRGESGMAKKRRRRGKGLGTVYRRGQLWSIAWVAKGVKRYEHGFPDERRQAVSSR